MAREHGRYGVVHASFWDDDRIQSLSERAQILALYLMTGRHATAAGAMKIPDLYVAADRGWEPSEVASYFAELVSIGFVVRHVSGWTVIRNRLDYDPPENPNQLKAVVALIAAMPKEWLGYEVIYSKLKPFADRWKVELTPPPNGSGNGSGNRSSNPSGTIAETSDPYPYPDPKPQPTHEAEPRQCRANVVLLRSVAETEPDAASQQDRPADADRQQPLDEKLLQWPDRVEPVPEAPSFHRRDTGRKHVWKGRIIALVHDDYVRWKSSYFAIREFDAELQKIDDWLAERPSLHKQWFSRASRWLANEHAKRMSIEPVRRPPCQVEDENGPRPDWSKVRATG